MSEIEVVPLVIRSDRGTWIRESFTEAEQFFRDQRYDFLHIVVPIWTKKTYVFINTLRGCLFPNVHPQRKHFIVRRLVWNHTRWLIISMPDNQSRRSSIRNIAMCYQLEVSQVDPKHVFFGTFSTDFPLKLENTLSIVGARGR